MIVQFGLSRTGSTLVYRVMSYVANEGVAKCHIPEIGEYINADHFFVTIRDPIDSFLSYVRVTEFPSSDNFRIEMRHIIPHINRRLQQRRQFEQICSNIRSRATFLSYEDFYDNISYIIQKIKATGREFNIDEQTIINECGIKSAIDIQQRMGSFQEYDRVSHIHGNHIMTPIPNEIRKMASDDVLEYLSKVM